MPQWRPPGSKKSAARAERKARQQIHPDADRAVCDRLRDGRCVARRALGDPTRGFSSIDEISKKIDIIRDQPFETSGASRALRQSSATQALILYDHEQRVRVLEAQGRQAIADEI
jgi:precorrin-2 methylase